MNLPTRNTTLAVVLSVAGGAIGFGAIAGAATTSKTKKSTRAHAARTAAANAAETPLTGDTLAKAKAAAEAAVAGGNAQRASTEDSAESTGAAYEVLVKKSDGSAVKVLEDSAFKVLSTEAAGGHGGRGGDHGGGGNESALTGETLTKAKAAAEAAVTGGTAKDAATEDANDVAGAAYEVHVTKADGSEVKVIEDKDFKVLKTESGRGGHGGRDGDHA